MASVFHVPNAIGNYDDHTEAQTPVSRYRQKASVTLASPALEGIGWTVS